MSYDFIKHLIGFTFGCVAQIVAIRWDRVE